MTTAFQMNQCFGYNQSKSNPAEWQTAWFVFNLVNTQTWTLLCAVILKFLISVNAPELTSLLSSLLLAVQQNHPSISYTHLSSKQPRPVQADTRLEARYTEVCLC